MIFSCCNARNERSLANEKLSPRFEEEVYPIHLLDQPTATQKMLTWVMCFNDVLNAPKIHESLCHLLEIGDWKKLGARLRVRVSISKPRLPHDFFPRNIGSCKKLIVEFFIFILHFTFEE